MRAQRPGRLGDSETQRSSTRNSLRLCVSEAALLYVLSPCVLLPLSVSAQNLSRLQGRVVTERGEPVPNAEVHVEAFYGYAAGTFAGQRTFTTTTDRKGDWNVLGVKSGVWLFEATAPGYFPESVALPIQLLTTPSSVQNGVAFNWRLILKPVPMRSEERGQSLANGVIPDDADAEELAGAGRLALRSRNTDVARELFQKALERDPGSYRAALGIATVFLLLRDFDSASRVLDAARNRTHDKDEIRFITIALSDLATIKAR
jgi:tetratricopeptide repeat protein/carboxypeptidase family protein